MVSKGFKRFTSSGRSIAVLTLFTLQIVLISTLVPEVISTFSKNYSNGECEECHTGFEPFITQVDSPTEVPETHEFDFGLLIQNPWAHDLNELVLTVDLTESPGLEFFGMEPQEPIDIIETDTVPARGLSAGDVMIYTEVEEIRISLDWTRPILFRGDLDLSFFNANKVWTETSEDEIIIDGNEIGGEDYGPFQWMVENTGIARSVDITLHIEVDFSGDTRVFSTHASNLGPGESGTLKLPLRSINQSSNIISYSLEAIAHYDHPDRGTDDEVYTTDGTHSLTVGDELKYNKPSEIVSLSTSLWIIGRVLGFVTVALFIASFLTGGAIESIRKWIDGKIQDRVRWHCVLSFMVIISTIVHLAVLYLGYYSNTWKGLLTGGIPLLIMIFLGITGYWKPQIAKKIGPKNWYRMHFWISIAVILLFVFHAIKEGTEFAFLRWW